MRRSNGFTLLEVLIALMILAIGVLAVTTMQLNATKNSAVGDVISKALTVAESRVELLRSSPPANLVDGGTLDTQCQQSVVFANDTGVTGASNAAFSVDCSYSTVCELSPCPPGIQTRQFTVTVTSSVLTNPVRLTGKVPLS
ncbi:MAG: type IV pilus modification protein PilV [bacterium]